ncbi:MAG: DUF5330 domain-containing protein, partial [Pseudolabrys sp.]
MLLWLGIVLILLPSVGSQSVPKSQVSASEALRAAKVVATDIQHFCERQREACVVGSQTTVTLGQRAQAGAKMLYEFMSEQLDLKEPRPASTMKAVPTTPAQTLRPADLVPPWRDPQPVNMLEKYPG